jgi:hypothetical protein
MKGWLFNLGAHVRLKLSEENGIVMGRAEFCHSENNYLVRYKAADGRVVESWWGESALVDDVLEVKSE